MAGLALMLKVVQGGCRNDRVAVFVRLPDFRHSPDDAGSAFMGFMRN
jgi:hypothetical protein